MVKKARRRFTLSLLLMSTPKDFKETLTLSFPSTSHSRTSSTTTSTSQACSLTGRHQKLTRIYWTCDCYNKNGIPTVSAITPIPGVSILCMLHVQCMHCWKLLVALLPLSRCVVNMSSAQCRPVPAFLHLWSEAARAGAGAGEWGMRETRGAGATVTLEWGQRVTAVRSGDKKTRRQGDQKDTWRQGN